LVGLYRTQWVGLAGAPVTQTFTLHTPIPRKHMGWGVSLVNDAVGPVRQTQLFLDYAYEIQVTKLGRLRMGLKGGFGMYSGNLEDEKRDVQADHLVVNFSGKVLPNIGVGLYYYGPRGYIGVSAPKLIKKNLTINNVEIGPTRNHWFLIGGYLFDLSEDFTFKPSFLMKAVSGAPLELDLTGMLFMYERLGIGGAYRSGDAFSLLAQVFITPGLYVGYAHDFTLTPLRDYHRGTHEFILGYDYWLKERSRIHSPRFF